MDTIRLDKFEEPTAPGVLGSLFRGRGRSEESVSEQRNPSMDPMKALAVEYRHKLREEAERKAEEERLKTLPLHEWSEFRQLMNAKMAAFNTHMQEVTLTWDSEDANKIVMTRKSDARKLTGAFDQPSSSMHIQCAEAKIDFNCMITVQSQTAIYVQAAENSFNAAPITRDGLTNNLLRDFLFN